ncbi:cytochrome c oxidase subunit 3 [Cellulophaga baltica]|uniref:cytochrome c oxidase subunit 3 n=1 Tax=Cellulophaga TaxID=104264 RepID=UPI001C07ECE8|nr:MULTISPECIES: cytochrome c oxidase subunit 3 [Cellulophaga]MBU2995203.1 cytochrome c oxidase subunit 3 [Cellulophaga baltica]MDO6766598.1 cytochrome c oxidase subunit 3 [Cellulophaga sp. 1_MG-2023]
MDLTQGTIKEKQGRAKKMMLWFGIVSLLMTFAGWTSAYIVSSTREDWLSDFSLPTEFYVSTSILIISSLTYILAKKAVKTEKHSLATILLSATLLMGFAFIFFQVKGFSSITSQGFYFTGETSSVTTSYIFLIAAVHILHVIAGIISLIVVLINQLRGKYKNGNTLGIELGATFWHFLDLLWLYLMLFFYFFK